MTYLDLFFVQGNALDDVETRCLVGLGICIVCCLKNCLVFCTDYPVSHCLTCSMEGSACLPSTYAVLFLFPLGCRSDELLLKDESGSGFSGESSIWMAESALDCGELARCALKSLWGCELAGTAAGDGG